MFSQACVKNSVHGEGACMAGGHACQGSCVVGVCVWQGGMHGAGLHSQGACMAGGMQGGRAGVWQGACMAGEMATAADGMHPTGMHSCL